MGFYDDEKNVEDYVRMAEGYDGRELIEILREYLADGSTVLELGMGPGIDLEMLAAHYVVTGSDVSQVFLDRYRRDHPDADLVQLDAIDLALDRRFDCIYSNKVLHHLTVEQLRASLHRQVDLLNDNGFLFHSFWAGEDVEEHAGMRFVQYTEASLAEIIDERLKLVRLGRYAEMGADDSIYALMQKRA